MPHLELSASALAPGISPVRVHYRDAGEGRPAVILHGGWGDEIYPFSRQIAARAGSCRFIAPDRTGYGQSGRLLRQETDCHRRAADETFAVIEKLGLARSDRVSGLILQATHLLPNEPASREFFETVMSDPDGLGERVTSVLTRRHGDTWRDLIRPRGDAWGRIATEPTAPTPDLYGGRLGDLPVPALVIHGARHPRTEPGELEAMPEWLGARLAILPEGGHSPHGERATMDAVTAAAHGFLSGRGVPSDRPDPPDSADSPGRS